MSHSFHNADRRTHAKIIFAAVLGSAAVICFLALGSSGTSVSGSQIVKAKPTVDVSSNRLNAVR